MSGFEYGEIRNVATCKGEKQACCAVSVKKLTMMCVSCIWTEPIADLASVEVTVRVSE